MLWDTNDLNYSSAGVPAGSNEAFQTGPFRNPIDTQVIDNRISPSSRMGLGTLWVEDRASTNNGDCFFLPSFDTGIARKLFTYGVLVGIPAPPVVAGNNTIVPGVTQGQQQIRLRQWGTANALCTTPSAAVAIAAGTLLTSDGQNNLMPFQPPSAAPTPTVTTVGTTGAATWGYKVVAVSFDGVYSAAGTEGTTATGNGNATLTNANFQQVSWTPVADAAYYVIVRTTSGGTPNTTGVVGVVPNSVTTFNDTGLVISENTSTAIFWPKLSAPGAPTVAQVSGATAGTTTCTYKVTAIGPNGVWSAESSATSLATSNATLSVINANKITWTAVAGATMYAIDRTAAGGTPSSTGFIGFANDPTGGFIDYGQAATTFTAQTTPTPTPRAGLVFAVARGALAGGTTTPTLTSVQVGGF